LKKFLLYIIIFAALCSLGNYSIDYTLGKHIENRSPYYISLASVGAVFFESRMDSWSKIERPYSPEELEAVMASILQELNLKVSSDKFIHEKTGNQNILRCNVDNGSRRYQFILESDQNFKETYIILTCISGSKSYDLYEVEEKLTQLLDFDWNFYYLYTGIIGDIIDYKSQEKVLDVVLKNLKARKLETYKDGKITSVTAYSSILEEKVSSVKVKGKKCNIQAAVRADFTEEKTYVYIGSPLILGDY